MRIFLSSLLLAACASGPTYYDREPWATVGLEQAQAECQAEINRPTGIPSMFLCLRSKGWNERQ